MSADSPTQFLASLAIHHCLRIDLIFLAQFILDCRARLKVRVVREGVRCNNRPIQSYCSENIVRVHVLHFGVLLLFSAFWAIRVVALLLDGSAREINCPHQIRVLEEKSTVVEAHNIVVTFLHVLGKRNANIAWTATSICRLSSNSLKY